MMSSLVNTVLFLALVATSVSVVTMYLKLKRLDAYHLEYKRVFDQTAEALDSASRAVQMLNGEGREILHALALRIEEAKVLTAELERSKAVASQQPASLQTPAATS